MTFKWEMIWRFGQETDVIYVWYNASKGAQKQPLVGINKS